MENCEEEMKAFIGLQFRSAALKDNLSSRWYHVGKTLWNVIEIVFPKGPNKLGVPTLSHEEGKKSSFRNAVFFRMRTTKMFRNPIIPSVIHHRQSPLESVKESSAAVMSKKRFRFLSNYLRLKTKHVRHQKTRWSTCCNWRTFNYFTCNCHKFYSPSTCSSVLE
jgi:transposase